MVGTREGMPSKRVRYAEVRAVCCRVISEYESDYDDTKGQALRIWRNYISDFVDAECASVISQEKSQI